MSKKKFNLKDYVKIDGDIPIGSRLMKEHEVAPEEITEKQLDKNRVPEKEVTIEKLLEKNRIGGADILPEGRLDTESSKLGKYRNSEAFEGDMNKVEEWRLANDPVEDEKYSDASKTPKKLRWWEEGGKSPDGLKLTSTQDKVKTAQAKLNAWDEDFFEDDEDGEVEELSFDEGREWQNLSDAWTEEEGVEVEKEVAPETPSESDFDIVEEGMQVLTQKTLGGPIGGFYMELGYDPKKYDGDEESIKDAALSKVIDLKPQLAGLISLDDFGGIKEDNGKGKVSLRAIGNEFTAIDEEETNVDLFTLVDYDEGDVGGTGITSGVVRVNGETNDETLVRDILDFVNDSKPNLNLTEESLDLSKVDQGIVGFLVSPEGEEESDFAINEVPAEELEDAEEVFAQAQSNVKKN